MTIEVHARSGRVVITFDALPDRAAFELLASQVRSFGADVPVVIDLVDAVVLRPTEVRELGSLLELLASRPVWIACPRLSGRRMIRCLLGGTHPLVGSPEEVPPGGSDPSVRPRPAEGSP